MLYSVVAFIVILVLPLVNLDVFLDFRKKRRFPGERYCALFLLSVCLYEITDALWGIFYEKAWTLAVDVDTTLYFIMMSASILLWGLFAYHHVGKGTRSNRVVLFSMIGAFAVQIGMIIVDLFVPIIFDFSTEGAYSTLPGRSIMLGFQIVSYVLVSGYTFFMAFKTKGIERRQHIAVAFFGLFMAVAITLQAYLPLWPMYSMGYLLGVCGLHSLLILEEKAVHEDELGAAKQYGFLDPLTGVSNKWAFIEVEEAFDAKIWDGTIGEFALAVFDLNDLKTVNDTYGHESGDQYITSFVAAFSEIFPGVELYRVGGDEFAAILQGDAFAKRKESFGSFRKLMEENQRNFQRLVVSSGMADFDKDKDTTILQTFTRADREMYVNKAELKALSGRKS